MLPRRNALSLICALSLAALSLALRADEPMEEVVVTGEFPGPGMWRVTRPEDPAGHVLWIVGDPPPLPKPTRFEVKQWWHLWHEDATPQAANAATVTA